VRSVAKKGITKELALEAAGSLIDREGLGSLTLTRLSEELGIRPPSLFNHFGSLADLMKALALRSIAELADEIEAACAGVLPGDGVRALLSAYRSYVKSHPGRYAASLRVSRSEAFADPDFVREEGRILNLGFSLLESYGLDRVGQIHALRGMRSLVHGFADIETSRGFGLDVSCDESFAALSELFVAGLESRAFNPLVR
jgi:AcrR family transcriptional regulator